MKLLKMLFLVSFFLTQISVLPVFADSDSPSMARASRTVIESPTALLGYKRIDLGSLDRYDEVYNVNSQLQLVGRVKNSTCYEVFGIDGAVARSFCLNSASYRSLDYRDVFLADTGDVIGAYYPATTTPNTQSYLVGFVFSRDGGFRNVMVPEGLDPVYKQIRVTGIDGAGTISGMIWDGGVTGRSFNKHAIAFYQKVGGPLVTVLPESSHKSSAMGIFNGVIFGAVQPIRERNSDGVYALNWLFDVNSQKSSVFESDGNLGITAVAENGDRLSTDRLYNAAGAKVAVQLTLPNFDYTYLGGRSSDYISGLSTDGYRLVGRLGGDRVQRGGQISDSLACSFADRDEGRYGYVRNIAKGGIVLWNAYGRVSLFVPSSTDELEDHCINLHVSIPPAAKKLFKVKLDCAAGYTIVLQKEIPGGTKFRFPVRVVDGRGNPLAQVDVRLDLTGDGRSSYSVGKTSLDGTLAVTIPFSRDYKKRVGSKCLIATIQVSHGDRSGAITVLNPVGTCGHCV